MKLSVIHKLANALQKTSTSHTAGEKIVLVNNNETLSLLTQAAIGILNPGETVEAHLHIDMEEFFYFFEGEGIYKIEDEKFALKPTSFIKIPVGKSHELKAEGKIPLKFIYWGIAIE